MRSKDILEMSPSDILKMNTKELRQAVRQLGKTANSRLAYADKIGASSPALTHLKTAGKISTKGKTLNQLRNEFKRAKAFLQSETSTVSGIRAYNAKVIRGLKDAGIGKVSEENYDKFWKAYERLKEKDPAVAEKRFKYAVLGNIQTAVDEGKLLDDIVNDIQGRLSEIYEESVSEFMEIPENDDEFSEFFEW